MADESHLESEVVLKSVRTVCSRLSLFSPPKLEHSFKIPLDLGNGGFDTSAITEQLGVIEAAFDRTDDPFIIGTTAPDTFLRFSYFLSENGSAISIEGEPGWVSVDQGLSFISYAPAPIEIKTAPKCHIWNVCIAVDPSFFYPLLSELNPASSAAIETVLNSPELPYVRGSPMTTAMYLAAEQLSKCPYNGSLRRMYLEGKALELIALQLHALSNGDEVANTLKLSVSDRDRVRQARQVLLANMQHPPILSSLARQVGVNSTKLKYGFKQLFGTTAFELLRRERLNRARSLLQDSNARVTEVSYDVGYTSLSHFAAAFKKEFGVSPHRYKSGAK